MSEFRHMRSGSLNIQSPSGKDHSNTSGSTNSSTMGPIPAASQPGAAARFDGPRSPPNTSHVPCKFFRQGACQAGSACPFSHDLGSAAETVCKYFAKGNCKFGPKCANVHVLADGRRINYGKNGITIGQPVHVGGRVNPSSSALTNSFMRADANAPYGANYSYAMSPGDKYSQLDHQPGADNGLPTIDTTYSHTNSQYGSPREEDASRLGLGFSPAVKGLSVLDAPLPASFDSNGISNAARFPAGPFPSSVPSQFGLESPSPSLNTAKEIRTSEALKLLHHSAFGSNDHLSAAVAASSPPTQANDEYYGRRPMHSSRYAKPHMLSSSAPRATAMRGIDRDWEAEFPFLEEDYVPDNLKDLLTPAEKARRGSRAADDEVNGHNGRRIPNGFSGSGTPNADMTSKFSSPMAASPSRWGPLFQRQKDDDDAKKHALAASAGVFGHVGSPLRNSTLNADLIRPHSGSRSGSVEGLSVLTQQLQRTRIDGTGGESPLLRPTNHVGRPTNGRANERHVSSSSISSSARYTTPIGEEDGEFVFSMDDDGDSTIRARKRTSGVGTIASVNWGNSYAGVTSAGKKDDGSSRVVDVGGGR
ncbi:spindle poison sensitivity protein [Apiospora arundinis]|uniref:Spindle poison sensitivity protein n=1 Tax=Apiospora arundinis TaxID=335852 RepID=A0ABR2JMK8_9PEZI